MMNNAAKKINILFLWFRTRKTKKKYEFEDVGLIKQKLHRSEAFNYLLQ